MRVIRYLMTKDKGEGHELTRARETMNDDVLSVLSVRHAGERGERNSTAGATTASLSEESEAGHRRRCGNALHCLVSCSVNARAIQKGQVDEA